MLSGQGALAVTVGQERDAGQGISVVPTAWPPFPAASHGHQGALKPEADSESL